MKIKKRGKTSRVQLIAGRGGSLFEGSTLGQKSYAAHWGFLSFLALDLFMWQEMDLSSTQCLFSLTLAVREPGGGGVSAQSEEEGFPSHH